MKSHSKATYVDKVTDISLAQGFLPEDKDSLHNTGIPAAYAIHCSGTSGKGTSLYLCPYGDQCSSHPYSSDIASTGSHVYCHHLGHCIQCPYDGSHFYNGVGWQDHMSSKHADAPWYWSQLGIDTQLPDTFFKATTPGTTDSSEATLPVSTPLSSNVAEPETLEHVPDVEDELLDDPEIEPEDSTSRPGIDIDSLTVADLKEITRFYPSDLRQYHYFGGGSWLGHHCKDDSIMCLFAAELASEGRDTDLPKPEEGEAPLVPKKQKHQMHLYVKEHGGKIWHPNNPKDDPDSGASMV